MADSLRRTAQTSFRTCDEVHGGFQHLVTTRGDALDRGLGDDVRDNAHPLSRTVIRVESAEAADHSAELAGQRDSRALTAT